MVIAVKADDVQNSNAFDLSTHTYTIRLSYRFSKYNFSRSMKIFLRENMWPGFDGATIDPTLQQETVDRREKKVGGGKSISTVGRPLKY